MSYCEFQEQNGKWICTKCGSVVSRKLNQNCKIKPATRGEPPLVNKLINFSIATIKHIANGMPTCTQEEIDERLVICKQCPLYKAYTEHTGVCTHENCGCNIKDMQTFLNKLAWKDQKCPENKW